MTEKSHLMSEDFKLVRRTLGMWQYKRDAAWERRVDTANASLDAIEEQLEATQERLTAYEEPGYITAVQKVQQLKKQLEKTQWELDDEQRALETAWRQRGDETERAKKAEEQFAALENAAAVLVAQPFGALDQRAFYQLRELLLWKKSNPASEPEATDG